MLDAIDWLSELLDLRFAAVPADEVGAADLAGLKPIEIRIINGRIDIPAEGFPAGVSYGIIDAVGTIPELETNSIAALNVAMTKKAVGIEVAEGVSLAQPILICHIVKGAGFSFAQGLLRLCEGASATRIETFEKFHEAKGVARRLRAEQPAGNGHVIRMIFAEDPKKAPVALRFAQPQNRP